MSRTTRTSPTANNNLMHVRCTWHLMVVRKVQCQGCRVTHSCKDLNRTLLLNMKHVGWTGVGGGIGGDGNTPWKDNFAILTPSHKKRWHTCKHTPLGFLKAVSQACVRLKWDIAKTRAGPERFNAYVTCFGPCFIRVKRQNYAYLRHSSKQSVLAMFHVHSHFPHRGTVLDWE